MLFWILNLVIHSFIPQTNSFQLLLHSLKITHSGMINSPARLLIHSAVIQTNSLKLLNHSLTEINTQFNPLKLFNQ